MAVYFFVIPGGWEDSWVSRECVGVQVRFSFFVNNVIFIFRKPPTISRDVESLTESSYVKGLWSVTRSKTCARISMAGNSLQYKL